MSREVYLTTRDNPYDPKTQFDQWYSFDVQKGYNTCAYLARIAKTADELSDDLNNSEVERAIDEIIAINLYGNYKKVVYEDGKLVNPKNYISIDKREEPETRQ